MAGASAGVGTLLAVATSLPSGKPRLLWCAGAVVTLFYAVRTIVGVSITTQFAFGVEGAPVAGPVQRPADGDCVRRDAHASPQRG
jgi:hypothetical protein